MLQLHMEPDAPLEVAELTASLGALAHRYALFVEDDYMLGKGSDARLLVWSVSPGSIDIAFLPDLNSVAGLLSPLYDPLEFILKFGNYIKEYFNLFRKDKDKAEAGVSIRDCNDAIGIAAPIANHGGSQNIVVIQGDVILPILTMPSSDAKAIVAQAHAFKALVQQPGLEVRQRVPLVWSRLDRDKAKSDGRTPDKAKIEEIDQKPRSVFFTDEMTFLKQEMIANEDNPYQMVYFVDVEVSKVNDKVASYRVIAYHGKDDLN